MQRYEPRRSPKGWAVLDHETDETLRGPGGRRSFEGAAAYSALLNDIEALGHHPAPRPAEREA
ncbi:MAG TPA: hypothetical protein VF138_05680 [Caulobacteraceae bacterium]